MSPPSPWYPRVAHQLAQLFLPTHGHSVSPKDSGGKRRREKETKRKRKKVKRTEKTEHTRTRLCCLDGVQMVMASNQSRSRLQMETTTWKRKRKKLEGGGVSETRSSKWNGWERGTRLHRSGEAFILGGQPSYQQQGSCRPVLRGGVRPHLHCPTQTFPVALPVRAGLQCQYSNPHIELSEALCAEYGTMHIPNRTNMQIPLTIPLAGG